jgi:IS6 family transposase
MSITPRSTALEQHYASELEKGCRPHLKAANGSWRVDETYIKEMRHSAKRFFSKALAVPHTSTPRVITVDKNAAYPKAFKELKAEEIMPA